MSKNYLKDELTHFGPVVLLNYGSGSVKRNGIYDQVVAILKEAGKTIVENPGVMSNPTLEKLREGVKIARENEVDLILALGGGSVCDYSKAVAASVSMAYYRRAMQNGLSKFVRFAKNVWNIQSNGMTDEQIAEAGLQALKAWMQEIGLPLTITQLGATEDMIPGITEGTICYPAGYLNLTKSDVTEILKESM